MNIFRGQRVCYCQPGFFGRYCQNESSLDGPVQDLDEYFSQDLSKSVTLYWRLHESDKEIEMVVREQFENLKYNLKT
jgi:hypothetical protein